jgi:Methyltransferase domain
MPHLLISGRRPYKTFPKLDWMLHERFCTIYSPDETKQVNPDEARRVYALSSKVHGWFSGEAAALFALLDEVQRANKVSGPLFEIGVHEGKSSIFLGAMVRKGTEFLAICDIFEQQEHNPSRSGQGKRDLFESNMRSYAPSDLDLRVFATLSRELTRGSIGTGYRFFHIDGGHNADEALVDLQLAASALADGGVIVIDDPFRPEWPGVTEGIIRFLDDDKQFRAVVVGFNKLVVVRAQDSSIYSRAMTDEGNRKRFDLGFPWHLKELPFVGHSLQIFYIPTGLSNQGWARQLYSRIVRG